MGAGSHCEILLSCTHNTRRTPNISHQMTPNDPIPSALAPTYNWRCTPLTQSGAPLIIPPKRNPSEEMPSVDSCRPRLLCSR